MDSHMVMESLYGRMVQFIEETIIKEKDKEMANSLIIRIQVFQEAFGRKEF
jgi:hypothetical protein